MKFKMNCRLKTLKPCLYGLLISSCLIAGACHDIKNEELLTAFSMSDTMMAKCKFHEVRFTDVKNEIRLFGNIAADNNKLSQIYPVVSGVVKSINVDLGDYVKQGQVLATIQSTEVASFQKEKLNASNDMAIAEKSLQVAKDLFAGKLTSEKDVTAAQSELEKAKAELNRINEVYTIYHLGQGSIFSIVAPNSGFVVTKKINQNEQIRSDNTEPLFSIAEIKEVWAVANVNESDISKVKVGYDVLVKTLAFPDEEFSGKIDKTSNAIDPQSKSMKVRVRIPNADYKLKPEMNCTVSVRYSENQNMATVPSSAVIFDKSKYWVMVFKNRNHIETRKVEVYRQLGNTTYIRQGLSKGENVISENGLLIYDALND